MTAGNYRQAAPREAESEAFFVDLCARYMVARARRRGPVRTAFGGARIYVLAHLFPGAEIACDGTEPGRADCALPARVRLFPGDPLRAAVVERVARVHEVAGAIYHSACALLGIGGGR